MLCNVFVLQVPSLPKPFENWWLCQTKCGRTTQSSTLYPRLTSCRLTALLSTAGLCLPSLREPRRPAPLVLPRPRCLRLLSLPSTCLRKAPRWSVSATWLCANPTPAVSIAWSVINTQEFPPTPSPLFPHLISIVLTVNTTRCWVYFTDWLWKPLLTLIVKWSECLDFGRE